MRIMPYPQTRPEVDCNREYFVALITYAENKQSPTVTVGRLHVCRIIIPHRSELDSILQYTLAPVALP